MATEWSVRAVHLGNCNCAYGCPCKFNALPTNGNCRSAIAYEIKEGYFGSIHLDGLRAVLITSWPGAIHEANGTMQVIIDERAGESQRDALLKILTGAETDDAATIWWVFSAMCPNKLEPLFLPIQVDIDVEARRGHIRVPDRDGRRADPKPGDRGRASCAYPNARRCRVPHRRRRQRDDPDDRANPAA